MVNSNELKLDASQPPEYKTPPKVIVKGCAVHITWDEPNPRGAPVTRYEVEFRSKVGRWIEAEGCEDILAKRSCIMPMTEFLK